MPSARPLPSYPGPELRRYEVTFVPGSNGMPVESVRTVQAVGYDQHEGWIRFYDNSSPQQVVYAVAAGFVWSIRLRADDKAAA